MFVAGFAAASGNQQFTGRRLRGVPFGGWNKFRWISTSRDLAWLVQPKLGGILQHLNPE